MTARGLEDDEKKLSIDLHNQLRAKLARGEEIRGHPGPQPPAANMMQMVLKHTHLKKTTFFSDCNSLGLGHRAGN